MCYVFIFVISTIYKNKSQISFYKLWLIDKSKDSIRTHTDLFFYTPIFEEIREGDISKFLTENFSWLDANTAAQIRELCNGNFYIAILYAHYFKEENSLDEPNIIANWWITKNVEDICVRNNFKRTDVRFLLRLISLLMPLNWEQDKERLKFLPPTLYNILENIVQAVYINYEEYPLSV
jgi:hypothetical protein